MIVPAAAIFIVLLSPAYGQVETARSTIVDIDSITIRVGVMATNAKTVQLQVLAREGITTPKALSVRARERLVEKDQLQFELQRVEVKGVGATDDSVDLTDDMFDKRAKPSHQNERLPSGNTWLDKWKYGHTFIQDMSEALSDTRGIPTPRSLEIISQLKGKKINEMRKRFGLAPR